jgi:DNA-binding HxlR family transcriptional regulator
MENHTGTSATCADDPTADCGPTPADLEAFRMAVGCIVGKWKLDIMWVLLGGPLRFGRLRRSLPGITQHMLTAQLRALEDDGLVTRTIYAEVPARVEYALTDTAHELRPVFTTLVEWSRRKKAPFVSE